MSRKKPQFTSPLSSSLSHQINYELYSFEYLKKREYFKSEVKLGEIMREEEAFTARLFSFSADGRKITGMANVPKKEGKSPVAILIRGWVDEKIYETGMGTKGMADFLARNGFLTFSPDLLGYGGSDLAYDDMLLTRFFRPVTIISLLHSLDTLPQANLDQVVMWGHSNGGQIALSVLEITGQNIPTSLWAPVSIPFPDSVLYFAEEMEDRGQKLREVIGKFEKEYQTEKFSMANYLGQIKAPLVVHQGMVDEAIEPEWSTQLVYQLGRLGKKAVYFQYPDENHNFNRGSASLARERDLKFFQERLGI